LRFSGKKVSAIDASPAQGEGWRKQFILPDNSRVVYGVVTG
jgi:hypothetical protein